MHLAGFEPAMSLWEADYESDAFGHLATDAVLELVGLEPTSTQDSETYDPSNACASFKKIKYSKI